MRIRPWLGAALGLVIVASACADDEANPRPAAGTGGSTGCGFEALAAATKPVEVTLWHAYPAIGDGTASRAFADLVDRFNASQPKATVRVKAFGSDQELVRRYFAIQPGERSPDLVLLPPPALRVAADTARILPVQACLDATATDLSDFVPASLAATRAGDVQWGLPDGHLADLLLYNKTAFAKAGLDPARPPATLAELRAAAERLRTSGVAHPIARINAFNLLDYAGIPTADGDNGHGGPGRHATFGTNDAVAIIDSIQGLVDDGLVVPPDPQGDPAYDLLAVGRGEAAMTMHTSLSLKQVGLALRQGQAPGLDLGIAPMPTLHGPARSCFSSGSFVLARSPELKHRAAAWTFLDWFESPAQQARWHAGSVFFPTRLSSVDDPSVAELWSGEPVLASAWAAMTSGSCPAQAFVGAQAQIGQALGAAFEDVSAHRRTAKEALAGAVVESDQRLDEYARDPSQYVRWLTQPEKAR